jgi:hypothetical protein
MARTWGHSQRQNPNVLSSATQVAAAIATKDHAMTAKWENGAIRTP